MMMNVIVSRLMVVNEVRFARNGRQPDSDSRPELDILGRIDVTVIRISVRGDVSSHTKSEI